MSRIYFAITFAYEIYFNNRPICLLLHFVINCEYAEAKTQNDKTPCKVASDPVRPRRFCLHFWPSLCNSYAAAQCIQ